MNGTTTAEDAIASLEAAREYAWNWFEFHAKQRQQSFHFYIVLITGTLGAYFFAMRFGPQISSSQAPSYSAYPLFISFLAVTMSLLFYRLDRRNRVLVRYAEAALAIFERDFAQKLGKDLAPHIIDYASAPWCHQSGYVPLLTTYGDIYRIIFGIGGVAGIVGTVVSWPPQGIGRLLNSLFI